MAPIITPVSAIVAGRINIRLRVRVVHVWTIPEFNRPQEDSAMHLLLLDEKVSYVFSYSNKHDVCCVYLMLHSNLCFVIILF